MIKPILTIPDERLRQRSQEITSFDKSLESLIGDLADTLVSQTDPPGLGLSAPQIGIFKRVFVAKIRKKQSFSAKKQSFSANRVKSFINPKIVKLSKQEVTYLEGCFSVPQLYGHVIRPAELDLEARDKQGKVSRAHYKGLPARIIQHEVDHLNGILFTDHVHDQNGKIFKVEKGKGGKEQLVEVAFA